MESQVWNIFIKPEHTKTENKVKTDRDRYQVDIALVGWLRCYEKYWARLCPAQAASLWRSWRMFIQQIWGNFYFFQSLCELWGETAQIDNPHLYPFKTNFVWKYVFWCHFLRLVGMGSCGGSGCRRRATRLGSTSISRGQKTNDDVSILSFPTTPTAKFPRQISTLEPVGRLMAWHLLQPWPQPLNQVLNQNFHS